MKAMFEGCWRKGCVNWKNGPRATNVCGNVEETVDISVVVIGGFAEDALQQIEEMVRDMLANVNGLKDVEVAGSNSNVALATFDSEVHPQSAQAPRDDVRTTLGSREAIQR